MKKIYISGCILMLFILAACEQEVDINIPDRDRKIIVNSLIEAGHGAKVNLTKSLAINDRANLVFLDDATIELMDMETGVSEILDYSSDGDYYGEMILENGNEYEITISRNNTVARASSVIPSPVAIQNVDTSTISFAGNYFMQCLLKFTDPAAEDNYYMFSLDNYRTVREEYFDGWNYIDTTYKLNLAEFDSDDLIIDQWLYINDKDYIMFSDDLISGKTYDLNIRVEEFEDAYFELVDTSKIVFHLYSVSEAYYNYFKTYSIHRNAQGSPFAEPVQMYSNVENGLGVFAGFSIVSDSITLIMQPFELK